MIIKKQRKNLVLIGSRYFISNFFIELSFCKKTPHNFILNEYVSIAGLFFNKTNTGFVNGILGKISKIIKENERN